MKNCYLISLQKDFVRLGVLASILASQLCQWFIAVRLGTIRYSNHPDRGDIFIETGYPMPFLGARMHLNRRMNIRLRLNTLTMVRRTYSSMFSFFE